MGESNPSPSSFVNERLIYAYGFSQWKKSVVKRLFPEHRISFIRQLDVIVRSGERCTLVVWGQLLLGELPNSVKVIRLEDGFLRSVGLGADLIRPLSWVKDERGIYYDASCASDLEILLQSSVFSELLLKRAEQFRQKVVAKGLTKYNDGTSNWSRSDLAQRIILVPGQVESDASLKYGAPGIRQNMSLLAAVRDANPDAYILYKPHPDVLAGLRASGINESEAFSLCNEVIVGEHMGKLLLQVDEVHVLTSLAGFEALLRGKSVTCYGQPFYAGWGLTNDILPLKRRTRKLSLDELVAGALLQYPSYFSVSDGRLTTPERAVDDLLEWRARVGSAVPFWRKLFRIVLRRIVGVR